MLHLAPCLPRAWRQVGIELRHGRSRYAIQIENPHGVMRGVVAVELDGLRQAGAAIQLVDDESVHQVRVVLGQPG